MAPMRRPSYEPDGRSNLLCQLLPLSSGKRPNQAFKYPDFFRRSEAWLPRTSIEENFMRSFAFGRRYRARLKKLSSKAGEPPHRPEQRPPSTFPKDVACMQSRDDSPGKSLRAWTARAPPPSWLALLVYGACLVCLGGQLVSAFECDLMRVSRPGNPKSGAFAAPHLNGRTIPPHGLQCIYTFIALPGERVQVDFHKFELAGRPPDCEHQYIDLYTELRNATEDLVQTDKFGGRFCGRIAPRSRISLFNTIVLVFSIARPVSNTNLFSGTYEFINASQFQMGTPVTPSICSFVIKSRMTPTGDIISPTYPGVYPQRIMCSYQFIGHPGQRVRVEFMDFDLFSGGTHCPYDRVLVYDGPTERDPLIRTLCGALRGNIVFSTQENLFISFITNRSGGENRGFRAIFKFANDAVKLDFLTGEHVPGTECDQRVLSTGRSVGEIVSPNWPYTYLPNVTCRYWIEALNDANHLEKVQLKLLTFHMPQLLGTREGDCSDGGITIYLNGKEETLQGKNVRVKCGVHEPNSLPFDFESTDSKLVLVFSSGITQGIGFKIRYQFDTVFGMLGTPHPISTRCEFVYSSNLMLKPDEPGIFHSPRHPSNYPSNTNCTYIFDGQPGLQVHVEFELFKLHGTGRYGITCYLQDHLEIFEIIGTSPYQTERRIGKYCGLATPAPIKTSLGSHGLRMVFVTDSAYVSNGFKGRYWFQTELPVLERPIKCGGIFTEESFGVISSPEFEVDLARTATRSKKYLPNTDCEWRFIVPEGYNILLNFTYVNLEGDATYLSCAGTGCGCGGAAIKIYVDPNSMGNEICGALTGSEVPVPNSGDFRSVRNTMVVRFVSSSKAIGGFGFEATWTQFRYPLAAPYPHREHCLEDEFYCAVNRFCIETARKCDGRFDCGENDTSDASVELCGATEEEELSFFDNHTVWAAIGAGAVGLLLVATVIVVCVCRRRRNAERRKKRRDSQQDQHDWNS